MAIETKNRTINGRTVTTTTFPARRALSLLTKLLALLGAPLSKLFSAAGGMLDGKGGKLASAALDMKAADLLPHVGDALSALVANLDNEETLAFVGRLLAMTDVDGVGVGEDKGFDLVFSGADLALLPPVLVFVCEVNFSGFFGELSKAAGLLKPAGASNEKTEKGTDAG